MKTIVIIVAASLFAGSAISARAADAKENWTKHCAQCHGPDGQANTKMGMKLQAKDLTSPKVQASFTDAQAATAIKDGIKENGKAKMIAFGSKLSDDEIKALVAYVRTLKK
ncbi:MAG: c-type cytochrome [Chthoniobacterales bacterium]